MVWKFAPKKNPSIATKLGGKNLNGQRLLLSSQWYNCDKGLFVQLIEQQNWTRGTISVG